MAAGQTLKSSICTPKIRSTFLLLITVCLMGRPLYSGGGFEKVSNALQELVCITDWCYWSSLSLKRVLVTGMQTIYTMELPRILVTNVRAQVCKGGGRERPKKLARSWTPTGNCLRITVRLFKNLTLGEADYRVVCHGIKNYLIA